LNDQLARALHEETVSMQPDEYEIFDLRVEVISANDGRPMVCPHRIGDYFTLTDDDKISIPAGQTFPLYPLAMLLPLLTAKQRAFNKADWIYTDSIVACPDPNCGGRFKISRLRTRTFRHGDMTLVPLHSE
jgi:uncharacterized repeat protein (TIGR04076 family)